MCSDFGMTHSPFGHRVGGANSDLIGADAPKRRGTVQISGKNVDMNIMVKMYTEASGAIKNECPICPAWLALWRQCQAFSSVSHHSFNASSCSVKKA